MDAATDSVGRSYKGFKTLDEFIGEVRAAAGTRYAPWLPELLEAEDTRRELATLLDEGRKETYADAYYLLRRMCEVSF